MVEVACLSVVGYVGWNNTYYLGVVSGDDIEKLEQVCR